ncbi:MAG: hypothetical protein JRF34_07070 [Deltaproteobacteria bacterium]|nr:hypothetical protein [Deltaproteobacteria bacterium]
MRIITKTILGIGVGYGLYFVASHHFIYFGGQNIKWLEKEKLTFSDTFYSATLKTNEAIIDHDVLREAGLPDLMVDMGLLSEKRKEYLVSKIEKKRESE